VRGPPAGAGPREEYDIAMVKKHFFRGAGVVISKKWLKFAHLHERAQAGMRARKDPFCINSIT